MSFGTRPSFTARHQGSRLESHQLRKFIQRKWNELNLIPQIAKKSSSCCGWLNFAFRNSNHFVPGGHGIENETRIRGVLLLGLARLFLWGFHSKVSVPHHQIMSDDAEVLAVERVFH